MAGFKAGKERLRPVELAELGDVRGKTLLHLQCHFGLDTLAWARHGTVVTGVDLSEESVTLARALSQELQIPAQFCCSDVYQLPDVLVGEFEIVFTSYGVLNWLPDLNRWAAVIAHFLQPGGIFYLVEFHPFSRVFAADSPELKVSHPYFFSEEPLSSSIAQQFCTPHARRQDYFTILRRVMPLAKFVNKVCPVILRQQGDGWQILAFRHPKAGTQLIKGTLEVGEQPAVGALRELAEESGINQATIVEKIGEMDIHEWEQHWHLYWCRPAFDPPEQWSHFTTDGGGLTFQFFWHPLAAELDPTWHAHFRQALALIQEWQQGRVP